VPLGDRLLRIVTATADARPLAAARVLVGLAAVVRLPIAARLFTDLHRPDTLRVPYVAWPPPLSAAGTTVLLVAWGAAAVALLVGWHARAAGTALALVLALVLVQDAQAYSNHLYLLATVSALLAVADAGAAWSLDAKSRGVRATVPAWPVTLLKTQVSVVYGFAALAKLNPEYLAGATLWAFLPALRAAVGPGTPPAGVRVALSGAAALSIVLEALVAIGLWVPALRRAAVVGGVALHAGMITLLPERAQLAVFALEMAALYVLFLVPAGAGPGGSGRRDSAAPVA
jgi:hypothetical protein